MVSSSWVPLLELAQQSRAPNHGRGHGVHVMFVQHRWTFRRDQVVVPHHLVERAAGRGKRLDLPKLIIDRDIWIGCEPKIRNAVANRKATAANPAVICVFSMVDAAIAGGTRQYLVEPRKSHVPMPVGAERRLTCRAPSHSAMKAPPATAAAGDPIANPGSETESVTVVVVAICGLAQLRRTLQALRNQEGAPPFTIVVAADPELGKPSALETEFSEVSFLCRADCRTPIELTTLGLEAALEAATVHRVLLTEDSCLPSPHWVRELTGTSWEGRGAVGGVVEPGSSASRSMWAFYFVDFFRYMLPVSSGESPTLSVCNVAYHRSHLDQIRALWSEGFHETEIHNALRQRFGPLYLCPTAEVRVRRNVRFGDAVYERYAFGRLFGATRVAHGSAARRAYYALFSPALPVLLMSRMTASAVRNPEARSSFVKALPALAAMVAAWSWGEFLGYVTQRRPRRITTAPEITASAESRV